jgi:tetratricopeptide (TPR) repeat protein
MKNRWTLTAMMAIVLMGGGFALADDWNSAGADKDGSIAMAERLSALGHQLLRGAKISDATWEQSAALCAATTRLATTQPIGDRSPASPTTVARFERALADNLLNVGDADGAINALKAYLRLQPDDQGAQVQRIDLQLSRYQSAGDKINYLHYVLKLDSIPKPVRSVAALRCAHLLEERSDLREALKLIDTALQLNPLNLAAMRVKYELTQSAAVPLDRVNQLLNMLRANPADPLVSSRLAMQLADLGLVNPSLLWFKYANLLYLRTGARPDRLFAFGAATEALLADKASESADLMKEYLTVFPGDAEGWFIRLATAKYQLAQGKTDDAANAVLMRQASIGLTNLLQSIRQAAGDSTATTRPINSDTESTLPDLSGDPARLAKAGRPDLADAYISAASSLAWLDLYFRHNATAADPLLEVLSRLLSPKDVQLVRLRGWRQYVGGDADGAIPVLQLASKSDPLAELGLALIDLSKPGQHDEGIARGKALLNAHPSGAVGAMVWSEMSGLGVTIDPSPQSDAVASLVNNIPGEFVQMVNNPETFYSIRAEPVQAIYQYGEPMLVDVLVKNNSDVDLAIGSDCALHPDLWFDAYLRGEIEKALSGVAVGRIDQRLVLPAGQSFNTFVRVDQDTMFSVLGQNPSLDLTINMAVVTNPAGVKPAGPNQPAEVVIGPCGMKVQLSEMLERAPTPISTQEARNKLIDRLEDPDGGVRIRTLEALATYVMLLRKSATPDDKTVADEFADAIHKSRGDPAGPVRAWARYINAFINSGNQEDAINAMAGDADWLTRLLAAYGSPVLGAKASAIAQRLSSDRDPVVQQYAKALSRSLAAAATQPESASPPPLEPTVPPMEPTAPPAEQPAPPP